MKKTIITSLTRNPRHAPPDLGLHDRHPSPGYTPAVAPRKLQATPVTTTGGFEIKEGSDATAMAAAAGLAPELPTEIRPQYPTILYFLLPSLLLYSPHILSIIEPWGYKHVSLLFIRGGKKNVYFRTEVMIVIENRKLCTRLRRKRRGTSVW